MPLGPTAHKLLPYLNFTIATAALCFQTTVLYPWHHELDSEFKRLKEEQTRMLKELHDAKLERIAQVEAKIIQIDHKLRGIGVRP
ncbi:hypothetical protein GGG16DRAFT_125142 [Schizophyllum commune]|uniref:Uncharacterized protein n=1 Tax=Schizophyllum commune (strain H4-8 / FGSC 9210) TaxID=578458 RepID=D8Q174_SCHCM|nr:uncharacterized protein SCHCODRAFT_02619025 [Schizophyllum commune H4-8]KAI5895300.1 hypothetical protein SCHCODRAFT_02619025 [Schizophyllum commune H4-8]